MQPTSPAQPTSSRKAIEAAAPGAPSPSELKSTWCNGLPTEHPEHKIFCLDSIVCPCSTMYRIHPSYLAWVLEALDRGRSAEPHHSA